jgi:hypothetical protein
MTGLRVVFAGFPVLAAALLAVALLALPGCVAYHDGYHGGGYHAGRSYARPHGPPPGSWGRRPPPQRYGWR